MYNQSFINSRINFISVNARVSGIFNYPIPQSLNLDFTNSSNVGKSLSIYLVKYITKLASSYHIITNANLPNAGCLELF